jgi:glycosyltransferase involved in cell wall biosynthesis
MFMRLGKRFIRSSLFVRICKSLPLALQVNVLKALLKADRSLVLLLPASLKKTALCYQTLESLSITSVPLILGYLPVGSDGWILEYLFRDIASFADRANFLLIKDPVDLCFHFFSSNSPIVFSLHPSFVGQIINHGIPPGNIVSFYTHSRLWMNVSSLATLTAVLPMNTAEAAALALSGIDTKKIRVFPAGYDPALFSPDFSVGSERLDRANDVLFVCRFVNASNHYYFMRKAYPLIIALGKALAINGYRVTVLGNGWEECDDINFKRLVEIKNVKHQDYPAVYEGSKLLVTPSLQEGGPVSWLEAMACGCLTLSTCSGFPAELRSGQLGSYLMPVRASVQEWMDEVIRILQLPAALESVNMDERHRFLSPATFGKLANVIEDIACESKLTNPSLSWPYTIKDRDLSL